MKTYRTYSVITLIVVACLTSLGIQAAPPNSKPVTVVNDAATPVPVDVTNGVDTRYVWVGLSSSNTFPDIGQVGLSQLCAATYPHSRMCTTYELLSTGGEITLGGLNGWIAPSLTMALADGTVVDFSGLVAEPHMFSCRDDGASRPWGEIGDTLRGLLLTGSGHIIIAHCAGPARVTCCAPQ